MTIIIEFRHVTPSPVSTTVT